MVIIPHSSGELRGVLLTAKSKEKNKPNKSNYLQLEHQSNGWKIFVSFSYNIYNNNTFNVIKSPQLTEIGWSKQAI